MTRPTPPCIIDGERCPYCFVIHGKEAEELRRAVEKLIEEAPNLAGFGPYVPVQALQQMLDDVDARDALIYVDTLSRKSKHRRAR